MCCDGFQNGKEVGECAELSLGSYCGAPVDANGDVTHGCNYSPVNCKTCGDAPCDGAC